MPAARLRNTLSRGLWRAGCWLQLAARRLEVAGPATALPDPAAVDAWEPDPDLDWREPGFAAAGEQGRLAGRAPAAPAARRPTGRPASAEPVWPSRVGTDAPPPHWRRLVAGVDQQQWFGRHAAPVPDVGDVGVSDPAYSPDVPDLGQPMQRPMQRPVPASAEPVWPSRVGTDAPPPHRRRLVAGVDPQQLRGPQAVRVPPRPPVLEPREPSGREAVGRWPSLPDDTPLWTPEWPDPVRDRVGRLDEEQRGTPWSG